MPRIPAIVIIEPRFYINCGKRVAFGPGKAELLERIERTGSITEAAKAMKMSYMRAWTMVKSMERGFAEPLVSKVRGGHTRGGATLSDTGREVLKAYRQLEAEMKPRLRKREKQFTALLAR